MPDLKKLTELADFFGVSMDTLLGIEADNKCDESTCCAKNIENTINTENNHCSNNNENNYNKEYQKKYIMLQRKTEMKFSERH